MPAALEALLGTDSAAAIVKAAGGLTALCALSPAAVLRLGIDQLRSPESVARATVLRAGIVAHTPLFEDAFGDSDDDSVLQSRTAKAARKALGVVARKIVLIARVDAGDPKNSGDIGREEREKLRVAFQRLSVEGRVQVEDTTALPQPQVHMPGEEKDHKRGGLKLYQQRLKAKQAAGSVLERAVSRVKMGVSEEAQQEELLQRSDVRLQLLEEQQRMVAREGLARKRRRAGDGAGEALEEYDDLAQLRL